MLGSFAKKIFGSSNDRRLKGYRPRVAAINALEPEMLKLTDAELAGRFVREIPGSALRARDGKPGKAFLNLRGIICDQLIAAGIPAHAITNSGPCTRCASDQYFSRRAAAGVTTGLQMSFVGFAP